MKYHITYKIKGSNPVYAKCMEYVKAQQSFYMYENDREYTLFVPHQLAVGNVVNGKVIAEQICGSMEQFQGLIHMCSKGYSTVIPVTMRIAKKETKLVAN